MELNKHVYLYRISLLKDGEEPLYYFGIRKCNGLPENDLYMGSPQTYKFLWENHSFTKKKDVIRSEIFNKENYEELRDVEHKLIKEAWKKYGNYSKGGRCLNMAAGKLFLMSEETRKIVAEKTSRYWKDNPNHPMKRPEVATKQAASMSKFLLENPDKNPNNLDSVKIKQRERMQLNNPMYRAEIREKVTGMNNPMYGKKHSEETRYMISKSLTKKLADPQMRHKISESSKNMWRDPEVRERILLSRELSKEKRIESLKKTNERKRREKKEQQVV